MQAVRLEVGGELAPEVVMTLPADHDVTLLHWSPSGRYLLFSEVWPDNPYETHRTSDRWMWAYFGHGLPTTAKPLPNLPKLGHYDTPRWDETTDALVVKNDRESYVVWFDGDRAEARLAVTTSVESYEVSPCRGAGSLLYTSDEQVFLVPAGASAETDGVALGKSVAVSDDRSRLLAVRPGASSGSQVLFAMDCRAGAMPEDLLEIEGSIDKHFFWPDNESIALVKVQGERTTLELASVSDPETPLFAGEFTNLWPSPDNRLVLLTSDDPDARYHLLELATGETRPLSIDSEALVEKWCGQRLLIYLNSEWYLLDPLSTGEPQLLVTQASGRIATTVCESSGEFIAFMRYTSSERQVVILRLAEPELPPLVYPLGPPIDSPILSFHADERGLLAVLIGPDMRLWWLPMPGGVPAAAGIELPGSWDTAVQPQP